MIETFLVFISEIYTCFSEADMEQLNQAIGLALCEIEAELVGTL